MLRISNEFFDSLDVGKISWQRNLRNAMSVQDGRSFPGIIWLRILLFFTIIFISYKHPDVYLGQLAATDIYNVNRP